MRDYTELCKRLRSIARLDRYYNASGEVFDDAADAIEELLAKVPTWISVEERLPEPFVCVLAHIPGEKPFPTVKSAFLEKNGLWYSNGFRYNPEEVTHWCEMPSPPKGVE
jgi:hypothetical protein